MHIALQVSSLVSCHQKDLEDWCLLIEQGSALFLAIIMSRLIVLFDNNLAFFYVVVMMFFKIEFVFFVVLQSNIDLNLFRLFSVRCCRI